MISKIKINIEKNYIAQMFALVITAMLFTGCSKSDGPKDLNEYYFRAKVNGKPYNFLHSAHFQGGGNDNKWQHIVISGYEASFDVFAPAAEWPPSFGFDFWNEGGDFPPGIYTHKGGGPFDDENPLNYSIDMEYHPTTSSQYDQRDTEDFTFEILEISESNGIKAKFKGVISHEDNIADKMVITEGELFLPFKEIVNP